MNIKTAIGNAERQGGTLQIDASCCQFFTINEAHIQATYQKFVFIAFPSSLVESFNPSFSAKAFAIYFLLCNKKSRCDFDDKLKVGDVRYKHLTQITIKVQLF